MDGDVPKQPPPSPPPPPPPPPSSSSSLRAAACACAGAWFCGFALCACFWASVPVYYAAQGRAHAPAPASSRERKWGPPEMGRPDLERPVDLPDPPGPPWSPPWSPPLETVVATFGDDGPTDPPPPSWPPSPSPPPGACATLDYAESFPGQEPAQGLSALWVFAGVHTGASANASVLTVSADSLGVHAEDDPPVPDWCCSVCSKDRPDRPDRTQAAPAGALGPNATVWGTRPPTGALSVAACAMFSLEYSSPGTPGGTWQCRFYATHATQTARGGTPPRIYAPPATAPTA